MTLTPLAKRTIDLAYLEVQDLDNGYIGTEHLLLGLLREGDGLAGRVLTKLGVELPDARRVTMEMQKGDAGENASPARKPPAPPADPWDRFEDDCRQAVVRAGEEALSRGQASISPEHVLLGLLASPGSVACRALAALDLDLDALWAETERRARRDDDLKPPETFLSPATNQAILLAYKEQTAWGRKRPAPATSSWASCASATASRAASWKSPAWNPSASGSRSGPWRPNPRACSRSLSASTMRVKWTKPRNMTSSFSNRENTRRKPLIHRKSRSISFLLL